MRDRQYAAGWRAVKRDLRLSKEAANGAVVIALGRGAEGNRRLVQLVVIVGALAAIRVRVPMVGQMFKGRRMRVNGRVRMKRPVRMKRMADKRVKALAKQRNAAKKGRKSPNRSLSQKGLH